MFGLFKTSKSTLQKKYDKMMKEAYDLSKVDPEASYRLQKEAQKVQLQLIERPV